MTKMLNASNFIHPTAEVSPKAKIGSGTKIWHFCQIRENVRIGRNCILGKNVYVDFEVLIGNNCKIQNNSSLFHGVKLADGVFVGPHVVFTNDKIPRAINANGTLKSADDWCVGKTLVKKGASIGAGSVILPGVKIGKYALVGAGSVVTHNVPDFGLVYGNPAQPYGRVDKAGKRIEENK